MITALSVVITLIIAFVISLIIIVWYYYKLKQNSHEILEGLNNTDICIANGVDEIKIICK